MEKKYILISIVVLLVVIILWLISSKTDLVEVRGVIEHPLSSWSPAFDRECISISPYINYLDEPHYLDRICPFLYKYGFDSLDSREVIIWGTIDEKGVDVPSFKDPNAPTGKAKYKVINVYEIKFVE